MHDYTNCYATLGVTPDTDWVALRARYKRLIGQWHPDRFSADAAGKIIAEERSKQITLAYKSLEKYRRTHGVLPPIELAAADAQRPEAGSVFRRPGSTDRAETSTVGGAVRDRTKRKPGSPIRVAIVLSSLLVAFYLAYPSRDATAPDDAADGARPGSAATQAPPLAENPRESGGVSVGLTLGEVYAVQGVPTFTEGDTWYYGRSQIRFAQGKVISWIEHPERPLRIAREQASQLRERRFDVGSTKDEVRAIQGAPVTETETVWDYIPSRVYFERNRVVRWVESPMQPLRVPH
jgi:outer membrane protein assembly factor BamE (lipoprotein component of BamABCDE complex)